MDIQVEAVCGNMQQGGLTSTRGQQETLNFAACRNRSPQCSPSKDESSQNQNEIENADTVKHASGENWECRACLRNIQDECSVYGLFQMLPQTMSGGDLPIVEHLNKLADIQISESDRHTKVICSNCFLMLQELVAFISLVQQSDAKLRQRLTDDSNCLWPKPILVSKNITDSNLEIEIKQEAVSDDENENSQDMDVDQDNEFRMDIKVEPEEIQDNCNSYNEGNEDWTVPEYKETKAIDTGEEKPNNLIPIEIKGNVSQEEVGKDKEVVINRTKNDTKLKDNCEADSDSDRTVADDDMDQLITDEKKSIDNSHNQSVDDGKLVNKIKEEPTLEDEIEVFPDLPLDCMLCVKSFRSVSGLKSHVIAQHSYEGITRKSEDLTPPSKYDNYCKRCNQYFDSSKEFKVHGNVCFKCFGCKAMFCSSIELNRHRDKCDMNCTAPPHTVTLKEELREATDVPEIDSSEARENDIISDVNRPESNSRSESKLNKSDLEVTRLKQSNEYKINAHGDRDNSSGREVVTANSPENPTNLPENPTNLPDKVVTKAILPDNVIKSEVFSENELTLPDLTENIQECDVKPRKISENDMEVHLEIHSIDKTDLMETKGVSNTEQSCDINLSDVTE